MKEITLEATVENVTAVLAFVDEALEAADCPMKAQMQLDIAVEEIFVNIAHYAYAPGQGEATVGVEVSDGAVTVRFADRGVPYNPLAKDDPNINLPAQERAIGGLGIFMTKKLTDGMSYDYRDGQNILTITKKL